jgi:hypothetical protein
VTDPSDPDRLLSRAQGLAEQARQLTGCRSRVLAMIVDVERLRARLLADQARLARELADASRRFGAAATYAQTAALGRRPTSRQ